MKIQDIRILPLKGSTPDGGWSQGFDTDVNLHTRVEVVTDEAVTGLGSIFTSAALVEGALSPHLPLDVDCVCPTGVAMHAAQLLPEKVLILPTIPHGYTGHVMDFPGTINHHYEHFIQSILDVVKSLAYHGFKKIILLNGHGSNMPNLDLAARRANLETNAECCFVMWTDLLKIDPEFLPSWRESYFPGGIAHAGELETSAYLYLDYDNVRHDLIRDGRITFNEEKSEFHYIDLFGAGPAPLTSWTSGYSKTGVLGAADLGTAKKGERAIKEAARQLARLVDSFGSRPKDQRTDHHQIPTAMPMPWNQGDEFESKL